MHRRRTPIAVLQGVWCLVATIGLFGARAHADEVPKFSAAELDFFETRIRPVLVEHCYECHAADADVLQGGLLLDSREGLLAGGDSGPAAVPGKPAESLLLEALRYESFEMPPDGKLPDELIADFERWIERGAPDPRVGGVTPLRPGIDIEEGRKFWCFQPIQSHEPPSVANAAWLHCDVDRFLLARLEERKLQPAADAERATWLRRVTFDLIGLPPTPEEIDAFVNDASPQAHERVVDRLLASPHFGERWGRHWLDVARFAESSGGGRSLIFKDAWRYRDYVIASFNQDKPLDEFITEQIAGDLLPHADDAKERDHLVATAYLLLGAHNYEEQDKRLLEMDVVDEQLDTISRGLLGMTVACARCHDHKFDPIPTADYYALAGIFRSTNTLIHENVSKWTTRPLRMEPAEPAALAAYEKSLAENEAKLVAARASKKPKDAKRVVILEKRIAGLKKTGPPVSSCMAVEEAKAIENCRICIRGSVQHRGDVVPRSVLQVATLGEAPKMPADASGRLELAHWITSPNNPLTARVYVNRVWHYLFGVGLVRTVDNFGTTGELPSHPELLDALAAQFIDNGWSTKRLIRELVLSHAYRMSSAVDDKASIADPENRLLARMNLRRLDAESLRDAMLTTAGTLDLTIGGRNISDEVLAKSSPTTPAEYGFEFGDSRRSVYTPAFRNRMHEMFEVFDFADQNRSVGARSQTTAAPQALLMLNSPFVMEQARAAAERALDSDENLSDEQRIKRAFRETIGRRPSKEELSIALAAVSVTAEGDENVRLEAWQRLFQGLFGCVDFRYLD
jgi:hypothetical protein